MSADFTMPTFRRVQLWRSPCMKWLGVILAVLLPCLGTAGWAAACHLPNSEHTQCDCDDSVWLVSTRHISAQARCQTAAWPSIMCWRCGNWQRATQDEFAASGVARTCFFVHGNRIESYEAPQLGLDLYQRLKCDSGSGPQRFVIWSWPSDQIRGPLRDARAKAEIANTEAFYFARFLQALPAEEPTSVIGFSYGAQVILGASQLLSGGTLQRRTLLTKGGPSVRPHVVLAASAVDANTLRPGGPLSSSLQSLSQLTLISNHHDPVLKRFHIATGQPNSLALGIVGITPRTAAAPIVQRDFADILGRTHSWERHRESPCVLQWIRKGAQTP